MSKRANPVTIGIFVVSAFVMFFGALTYLGVSKYMKENPRFVVFFDESVNGLDVGAWVKFKGVPVGRVAEIKIRMPNQMEDSDGVPVIVELYDDLIVNNLGAPSVVSDPEVLAMQIRSGLRARLNTESLITGLLFVELDFVENAPEPIFHQDEAEIPEIPTIPSQLQEIAQSATEAIARIGDIDFGELGRNINRLLYTVNMRVEQVNTRELSERLNKILANLEKILEAERIDGIMNNADATVTSIKSLADTLNASIPAFVEDINGAVADLKKTLNAATSTLETVEGAVSPDSAIVKEVLSTLDETQSTLKSFKDLATFIENNPNAFLTGRSDN